MQNNFEQNMVRVPGATLTYTVEGSGTPLLVVGSAIYYPRTFSQHLRQSCLLLCADLPHFVQVDPDFKPEHINFDFYAECIDAVRAAVGLEHVVVAGHSHHGNIALEYAKRYPQRVCGIVLIGSPPVDIAQTINEAERYWDAHASEERKTILLERRRAAENGGFASLSLQQAYISQYVADAPLYWNNPNYDAAWLWEGMRFEMAEIQAFRNLYQDYELNWEPETLSAPVLVIMGENDYAVPHTLWEKILPKLTNISFHVLKHSGHTPQLEQPEVFDELLLSWLQNKNPANRY